MEAWNPEVDKWPRTNKMEDITGHLYYLLDNYSDGDIDSTPNLSYKGTVNIVFKGHSSYINITIRSGISIINLTGEYPPIRGIGGQAAVHHPCMTMRFDRLGCTIDIIRVLPTCPIPSTRSGTWLMELADTIADALGCAKANLTDESHITCGNEYISLPVLRLFEGRDTWYSNFGFYHAYREEWLTLMDHFSTTLANEYFMIDTNETVSEYMVRLYRSGDCVIYNDNIEILYNVANLQFIKLVNGIARHYKDYY